VIEDKDSTSSHDPCSVVGGNALLLLAGVDGAVSTIAAMEGAAFNEVPD
jgi:hypothetical protein